MRQFSWKHLSIATKLSLVMTGMIVASVLSVTILSIRRTQHNFREELEQNAELVLDTLQAETAHELVELDLAALAGMIEVMAQDQRRLVSGRFYDQQGRVVVDAFDPEAASSSEVDPLGSLLIDSEQTLFEWTEDELLAGRAIVMEGADRHLGAISISFPLARFEARVASVRNEGLIVSAVTAIAGVLIALLLSRSITGPLRESVKATERIAQGDLWHQITVSSGSDEMAVLTYAMERMRAEMKELYESLERQVAQRTRELKESEARFRRVINSISDVIYQVEITLDNQWAYRFLSPSLEKLTGYPVERFIDDNQFWPSLIHPDDRESFSAHIERFTKGQNSEVQYRLTHADETTIWVRDNGRLERETIQPHKIVYGVISNITERQVAAAERERLLDLERDQRLRAETLSEVTLALTSQTSLEMLLDEILRQVKRVVPYSIARISLLMGNRLVLARWRRYQPDIGQQMVSGMTQPLAELPNEARILDSREAMVIPDTNRQTSWVASAERKWVRSYLAVPICQHDRALGLLQLEGSSANEFSVADAHRLQPLANAAAIAIENAHLVAELGEKVAARTADVQTEQELNATILRNISDAIIMTGLDMRIKYVNQAFIELTGYTEEDVLEEFIQVVGISMDGQVATGVERMPNHPTQQEVAVRRKDGSTYEAALTVAPVFSVDGHQIGYVSSHRDVSHAKALERVRSRFTTNVSHQLRTPVTNIKLYADLLQRSHTAEKQSKYLKTLLQETDRLEHLVQDILEMTSLDSRSVSTAHEEILTRNIISTISTRYQDRVAAAGLRLRTGNGSENNLAVRGDEAWLTRALCELLDNAIAFTPPGGLIRIETEAIHREDQRWACIAVDDTGPGISADEQKRIFDRFYRGRIAESGHIPGTGLGLCIVSEITRAHGGRVTLESEAGMGSRFTLWLPAA